MKVRYRILAAGLIFYAATLSGQDTWYGSVSGLQSMYNPAFTGTEGVSSLKMSAFSFLPGKGFGLRSVYASWEGYFTALHGGAGVWITDDIPGEIMNDLRGGASWSYHFRAGRNLYVTAGLNAGVILRGIRSGSVILPDNIDPFRGVTGGGTVYFPPAPVTRFDLGTGFTLSSGNWYAGASLMHLTRPSLSADNNLDHNRIKRLLTLTGGIALTPGEKDLSVLPSAAILVQGEELKIYLGGEVSWKEVSGGLFLWQVIDGFTSAGVSAGWNTSNVRIIMSYSYIVAGGGASLGGTAVVKAGAIFGFGNVEKSKAAHIIKLPLL